MNEEPDIQSQEHQPWVPGMLVECIDDDFPPEAHFSARHLPEAGRVYTIREVARTRNSLDGKFSDSFRLEELQNPSNQPNVGEVYWNVARFRQVTDAAKKTVVEDKIFDPTEPGAVFELALSCPAFSELKDSNPGLAALILWEESWCGLSASQAQARMDFLASQKRRSLCIRYGLPESPAILRLLSAWDMPVNQRNNNRIEILQARMAFRFLPEALEFLARFPYPTPDHLRWIVFGTTGSRSLLFSLRQLKEGNAEWFFRLPAFQRYHLAQEWGRLLTDFSEEECSFLIPLRSLGSFPREKEAFEFLRERRQLLEEIREKIQEYLAALPQEKRNKCWQTPPWPGTANIQPITCHDDLLEEGRQMRHCIADFSSKIWFGHYFVYRMLAPVRCTVGLKYKSQHWTIDDVRGPDNSRIEDAETRSILEEWARDCESKLIVDHPRRHKSIFERIAIRIGRLPSNQLSAACRKIADLW